MTLWQRIKSWFGFKPKAVPSKFGSSYDFNDDHYIEEVNQGRPSLSEVKANDLPYPASVRGIRNASTKEKNGVFIKDGILSAGSQRDNFADVQPVRRATPTPAQASRPTPVRSYGESECDHNYSARIGGVTTSSLRSDGSFVDGMLTGYLVGEALEAVGDLISGGRSDGFTETRSAPEPTPVWQEPAPIAAPVSSSSWNDSGSTNWGGSNSSTIDGGSNWISDVAESASSIFSD
jgi:hypothetical protein